MKQYLCSHLVTLFLPDQQIGGTLERIWESGATVDAEEFIAPGTRVTLSSPSCQLPGIVISCESDPLGNFIDMAFDNEWTLETFLPDHLIDVTPV